MLHPQPVTFSGSVQATLSKAPERQRRRTDESLRDGKHVAVIFSLTSVQTCASQFNEAGKASDLGEVTV